MYIKFVIALFFPDSDFHITEARLKVTLSWEFVCSILVGTGTVNHSIPATQYLYITVCDALNPIYMHLRERFIINSYNFGKRWGKISIL